MQQEIVRSQSEIDAVYESAMEGVSQGSKFSGMSYEEGIIAMLAWLTGDSNDNPMED